MERSSRFDSAFVPKGTQILASTAACNWIELWGEDADEWKPERWLKGVPSAVDSAHIPGSYFHLMTFHGGGHSRIGSKFSQMEMKTVLSLLLSNFKFKRSDKPAFWNHSGVSYPSTDPGSAHPEL